MHFHEVIFRSQHELWSKQHNGKVSRFCANMRLQEFKILVWVGSPLGKSTEGGAARHQQDRLQQNQQLAKHPVREKTTRGAPVIFPGVSHGEMHYCPPLLSNKKNDSGFSDPWFQRAFMNISGRYPMKVLHTQRVMNAYPAS